MTSLHGLTNLAESLPRRPIRLVSDNHPKLLAKRALVTAIFAAVAATASAENIEVLNTKVGNGVPTANQRVGAPDNVLTPGFALQMIAQGIDPLENPSGVITTYGFLNDFPPQPIEATKTEGDENTYLVLDHNPGGPTPGYDYGRHFLFQGHEIFSGDIAYVTRINLDVSNPDHRITLLTPVGTDGKTHTTDGNTLNDIDGSTWDPFSQSLLFAQEKGNVGGVIEIPLDWQSTTPPTARALYGSIGRGGFEGIHPDDQGNLIIIEDVGGVSVNVDPNDPNSPKTAKLPNSFVYRFVPNNPGDLTSGKLQALQVFISGQPVKFVPIDVTHPTGDVFSDNQLKLHTPGTFWPCRWVTVHDTAGGNTAPFDANAAAKAAGATPFKRPENAQFVRGTNFRSFVFDPTGDTDSTSGNVPALAARGAWGSIFRVDFSGHSEFGTISILVLGDAVHSSFDNLTFATKDVLLAAEDRGDTLHKELNTLDSIWAYDLRKPDQPVRFLALGRDRLAEIDAGLAGTPGFQNDGDNEPTGLHFSDGAASVNSIIGSRTVLHNGRLFFSQQHGENNLYEVLGEQQDE